MEKIILVDENDNEIGSGQKQQVHAKGKLHRAFSIYVFNSRGELLLQKRKSTKYHSGGLWTNTCCGHPRLGENLDETVHRRLREEMGFDCELTKSTEFIYQAKLDNGLTEHEYLHVYTGQFDGAPVINEDEAENYKWMSLDDIRSDIAANGDDYTYWLKLTMDRVYGD